MSLSDVSVSMAGIKLIWEAGQVEKETDQEISDGKNLVRMRSILSLKKSRNVWPGMVHLGTHGSERVIGEELC